MPSHTSAALMGSCTLLVASGCPPITPKIRPILIMLYDTINGGNGRITGTVKEAGTPDTPVHRRVRLHRRIDGMVLGETWSAADGSYVFNNITIQPYYVTSFDHTGNYNAVIKDSITPEVMP